MQSILISVVAAGLVGIFIGFRRPSRALLSSTDTKVVAEINRAQLELVLDSPTAQSNEHELFDWIEPRNERERLELKKQLCNAMFFGPEERLKAVKTAEIWGHKSVLTVLRRGLRDSDPNVVVAAAKAIDNFRSSSYVSSSSTHVKRLPRNVFLMR